MVVLLSRFDDSVFTKFVVLLGLVTIFTCFLLLPVNTFLLSHYFVLYCILLVNLWLRY